jgi:hypothetical protein
VFIYFSNFLKFSYGLVTFFLLSSSLYLVPYSSLAFFCRSLVKFMPRVDVGRPEAVDAPGPARD